MVLYSLKWYKITRAGWIRWILAGKWSIEHHRPVLLEETEKTPFRCSTWASSSSNRDLHTWSTKLFWLKVEFVVQKSNFDFPYGIVACACMEHQTFLPKIVILNFPRKTNNACMEHQPFFWFLSKKVILNSPHGIVHPWNTKLFLLENSFGWQ